MGKASRNKANRKKQFYKNPNASQPENGIAKEILFGLDSTNPQTRIGTSGAISALFGDMQSDLKFVDGSEAMYKANLDMIVNSPLLKKIISRTTDSEYLVCMNILGALRNMCIVGGDEFIKTASDLNIVLPLKNLLYKNVSNLNSTKENDQLIGINIYIQLFSLLTIIFDYDASGLFELESDGEQTVYSIMLFLLSFAPEGSTKMKLLLHQMHSSVAEFISVMSEHFYSNQAFMMELHRIASSMVWSIRYKIAGAFIHGSSPAEQIALLTDALQVLETTTIPAQLADLHTCYSDFAAIQAELAKNAKEKEEILNDAEATQKMNEEALDKDTPDREGEVVRRSERISQDLEAHLNILDVIARILSRDDNEEAPLLALPGDLVARVEQVLNALVDQITALGQSDTAAVESLRLRVLSGILETLVAFLPYMPRASLPALWTRLQSQLALGGEVLETCVKGLWMWSQMQAQAQALSDEINPVCFPEQIAPVLQQLMSAPTTVVVQLVNMIAGLLSCTMPNAGNQACLLEVCKQVVHALDVPANNADAEVLGAVLDFMMTVDAENDDFVLILIRLVMNSFGNEVYVPIFKELNVTSYVNNATYALQGLLQRTALDEDCAEYLNEILSNAVRFIDWIQGGMK